MIYGVLLGNSSKQHVVPDRIWGQPDVTGQGDDVEGAEHQTGQTIKTPTVVFDGLAIRRLNNNLLSHIIPTDKFRSTI
jgi:hypothetical protein